MYANNFDGTDPESYLAQRTCDKNPSPESQWQGENINRFCDPAYDALVAELGRTGELSKRGEIAKKLNDMLTKESYSMLPLVDRGRVSAQTIFPFLLCLPSNYKVHAKQLKLLPFFPSLFWLIV